MEITTRWHRRSSHWSLEAEINFDSIFLYHYLAAIEKDYYDDTVKGVYVVTFLFDDYPDPTRVFKNKEFTRLKDAKAWAQKQVINGLKQMIRDIKKLK